MLCSSFWGKFQRRIKKQKFAVVLVSLTLCDWSRKLAPHLDQSDAKVKPITTGHSCFPALQAICFNSEIWSAFSEIFLWSDRPLWPRSLFWFGSTTTSWKPYAKLTLLQIHSQFKLIHTSSTRSCFPWWKQTGRSGGGRRVQEQNHALGQEG